MGTLPSAYLLDARTGVRTVPYFTDSLETGPHLLKESSEGWRHKVFSRMTATLQHGVITACTGSRMYSMRLLLNFHLVTEMGDCHCSGTRINDVHVSGHYSV